jgi:5-enolpyruvylshikimate-3-phosphate synthase
MIARRIAGMFMSGRIKFKRPRDVRKTYPEWFA